MNVKIHTTNNTSRQINIAIHPTLMRGWQFIKSLAQILKAGLNGFLIHFSSCLGMQRFWNWDVVWQLWKENADRIPADWEITLTDLSAGMLDAAWRNLVVTGREFQFKEMDAQSIPFEDETFDAVIANHMLYHVPDRPKGIAEIKRVLKADGRLFATTVGENHMKEMMDWYRQVHVSKLWESFANSFTLENGLEQLKLFFSEVTHSRYEDNL